MPTTITRKQFNILEGFYQFRLRVEHYGRSDDSHKSVANDNHFWASHMDENQIPWAVQNTVAFLAEDKSTTGKYLRNLLKSKDVEILQ